MKKYAAGTTLFLMSMGEGLKNHDRKAEVAGHDCGGGMQSGVW